jgi:hypothetical protein
MVLYGESYTINVLHHRDRLVLLGILDQLDLLEHLLYYHLDFLILKALPLI